MQSNSTLLNENLLTVPETGLYKVSILHCNNHFFTDNKGISRQGVSETPDGKTGGSVTLPRPLELELELPPRQKSQSKMQEQAVDNISKEAGPPQGSDITSARSTQEHYLSPRL